MIIRSFAWQLLTAVLLTTGIIWLPPLAWSSESASSVETLPVASGKAPTVSSGQKYFEGATYVGSESCKSCHEKAYTSWKNSWHSKANRPVRPVRPEIMDPNFDNVELKFTKPKKLMDAKGKAVKDKVTVSMRLHREDAKFRTPYLDHLVLEL